MHLGSRPRCMHHSVLAPRPILLLLAVLLSIACHLSEAIPCDEWKNSDKKWSCDNKDVVAATIQPFCDPSPDSFVVCAIRIDVKNDKATTTSVYGSVVTKEGCSHKIPQELYYNCGKANCETIRNITSIMNECNVTSIVCNGDDVHVMPEKDRHDVKKRFVCQTTFTKNGDIWKKGDTKAVAIEKSQADCLAKEQEMIVNCDTDKCSETLTEKRAKSICDYDTKYPLTTPVPKEAAKNIAQGGKSGDPKTDEGNGNLFIYIGVGAGGLVVVIIIILIVCCCRRKGAKGGAVNADSGPSMTEKRKKKKVGESSAAGASDAEAGEGEGEESSAKEEGGAPPPVQPNPPMGNNNNDNEYIWPAATGGIPPPPPPPMEAPEEYPRQGPGITNPKNEPIDPDHLKKGQFIPPKMWHDHQEKKAKAASEKAH